MEMGWKLVGNRWGEIARRRGQNFKKNFLGASRQIGGKNFKKFFSALRAEGNCGLGFWGG